MHKIIFSLFLASALSLLAAPTAPHAGHAHDEVQNVSCPKFGCFGFLREEFGLPPIGYSKVYVCSNGHRFGFKR